MIAGTPRLRVFAGPNGSGKSVLKAVLPLPLLEVTTDPKGTIAKFAQVRSVGRGGLSGLCPGRFLSLADEVFCRHADVLGDLTKQWRRDVTTLMERNGGAPAKGIPELLVGSSLSHFHESHGQQDPHHFRRFQNR